MLTLVLKEINNTVQKKKNKKRKKNKPYNLLGLKVPRIPHHLKELIEELLIGPDY